MDPMQMHYCMANQLPRSLQQRTKLATQSWEGLGQGFFYTKLLCLLCLPDPAAFRDGALHRTNSYMGLGTFGSPAFLPANARRQQHPQEAEQPELLGLPMASARGRRGAPPAVEQRTLPRAALGSEGTAGRALHDARMKAFQKEPRCQSTHFKAALLTGNTESMKCQPRMAY